MSAYSRSARTHRLQRRIITAAPVLIIVVCAIGVAAIVIHFRLALP